MCARRRVPGQAPNGTFGPAFVLAVLQAQSPSLELHAPTVIDGCAGGAENWIFCKRQAPSGPDWGFTVDMDGGGACARGSREAVHGSFTIPAAMTGAVTLNVIGEIQKSCPQIDYDKMYKNPGL